MTTKISPDLLGSIERARRQRQLSQAELAIALDVTQGHYSKVVRKIVPASSKLRERAQQWLIEHGGPAEGEDAAALRMRALAASIRAQCMELMHLADQVVGSTAD